MFSQLAALVHETLDKPAIFALIGAGLVAIIADRRRRRYRLPTDNR